MSSRLAPVRTWRKALTAGLVAGATTYGALLTDGATSIAEGLIALGAALTAGAATYKVRNDDA